MKKIKGWCLHLWQRLIELKGNPRIVARGFAIGVFWGFSPLFGFKTLISMLFAWASRGSVVAAVIGVSIHDVFWLFPPILIFLLQAEYHVGCWVLSRKAIPIKQMIALAHHEPSSWWTGKTLLTFGEPILVGSCLIGLPLALLSYALILPILLKIKATRDTQDTQVEI